MKGVGRVSPAGSAVQRLPRGTGTANTTREALHLFLQLINKATAFIVINIVREFTFIVLMAFENLIASREAEANFICSTFMAIHSFIISKSDS